MWSVTTIIGCYLHVQVIEVYPFDYTNKYVRGFIASDPGVPASRVKKVKFPAENFSEPGTETYKFMLETALDFSYTLSQADVLQNYNVSMSECQVCGNSKDLEELIRCDGCSPHNIGCTWPQGALGRQFACFRGALCASCYKVAPKINKRFWYCSDCVTGPSSHFQVWGHDINEPRFLRAPGSMWASSTPTRSPFIDWSREPSERYTRRLNDRLQAAENTRLRLMRCGAAEKQQESAVMLIRELRDANFSNGEQQRMLSIMNKLHEHHLLVESSTSPLLVPKTLGALKARATGTVVDDSDVTLTVSQICMTEMLQPLNVVEVSRVDIAEVLQSMLLDEDLSGSACIFEGNNSDPRVYVDLDDNFLQGPEIYHGTTYSRLLATVPDGAFLIVFSMHSDGVNSFGHSRHPFHVMLENVPTVHRDSKKELRCLGMGNSPCLRKPRNSNIPEDLNPDQRAVKATIISRVGAELLADAEELARTGAEFVLRAPDGSLFTQ